MDRRATLATLLGRRTLFDSPEKHNLTTVVTSDLTPYSGPWEFAQAAHLLRRAMFGPNYQQIKNAVANGLDATVNQLLADLPLPAPPLNPNFADDPFVPIGETWVDAPYTFGNPEVRFYREQSLFAWTIGNMLQEGVSVREKMTLFWHNHFVTSTIDDPKYVYRYITLLRSNALGNFRQLAKDVTIDPAMLRYLNGNQNIKQAPNENYARELLELFTIGKGEQVGPGDYTHYTEDDVIEIAKVLTGWDDEGYFTFSPDVSVGSAFKPNRHDTSTKQLSYRFDNVQIPDAGENEYKNLIDIIFQQDEVARFISRKLYRWFIYYDITPEIEANVIDQMAQVLIDNDYEIKPVLEALFKSEHFYDMLNVGPMIKNPIDFLMSVFKPYEVAFPPASNLPARYQAWVTIFNVLPALQMLPYYIPEVAGWKAYYQGPAYYRVWINSVTLPYRMQITDLMSTLAVPIGNFVIKIEALDFLNGLDNPSDPNSVVDEIASILFPQPLTENQRTYLKGALIPGLPDFEWTVEYSDYLSDPSNTLLALSVELKFRNLLKTMMNMPEFYLS